MNVCVPLTGDERGRGEWHEGFLPTFLTHLSLQSEISRVRQLRLPAHIVMGSLADKAAVSFVNSDLRIPSALSDPQAPKQAGSPPEAAQIRTADRSISQPGRNCWHLHSRGKIRRLATKALSGRSSTHSSRWLPSPPLKAAVGRMPTNFVVTKSRFAVGANPEPRLI